MAKRGRTPSYTPDYCTIAYKFSLLGATNEDLAGVFEVSRNTIGNWLAHYPEFKKAMQDGRDVADVPSWASYCDPIITRRVTEGSHST